MIAKIMDAEGALVKVTEGDLATVLLNVPPGGSYEELASYTEEHREALFPRPGPQA